MITLSLEVKSTSKSIILKKKKKKKKKENQSFPGIFRIPPPSVPFLESIPFHSISIQITPRSTKYENNEILLFAGWKMIGLQKFDGRTIEGDSLFPREKKERRRRRRRRRWRRWSVDSFFFFFFLFFFSFFLNRRVRLLVLLRLLDVGAPVHVFRARVYRILLATLRYFLIDDTRVLVVILFVLVPRGDVRLASGADTARSFLVAPTPRCNKQRHDRSRQKCVCGSLSLSLSLPPFFSPPLFYFILF